jgi:hypothetical protein
MPRERIPAEVAERVRQTARGRCGYCLSPQLLVMARLGIGTSARDPDSGADVPLFNPWTERWSEHFRWSEDGLRVIGLTPTGRSTVAALHLADDPDAALVRAYWVLAGWHPPTDV